MEAREIIANTRDIQHRAHAGTTIHASSREQRKKQKKKRRKEGGGGEANKQGAKGKEGKKKKKRRRRESKGWRTGWFCEEGVTRRSVKRKTR